MADRYKKTEDPRRRIRIEDRGPTRLEARITEIKCCRQWLDCSGFTNTCPQCDADYNWAGQRLAPREQWGEETGEHPADIARIR